MCCSAAAQTKWGYPGGIFSWWSYNHSLAVQPGNTLVVNMLTGVFMGNATHPFSWAWRNQWPTAIDVQVCRQSSATESGLCTDGLDNVSEGRRRGGGEGGLAGCMSHA